MVKCSFCKFEIPFGTGTRFIQKDGKPLDFCSNKCEKNMLKLGRKGRSTKWTAEYKKQ